MSGDGLSRTAFLFYPFLKEVKGCVPFSLSGRKWLQREAQKKNKKYYFDKRDDLHLIYKFCISVWIRVLFQSQKKYNLQVDAAIRAQFVQMTRLLQPLELLSRFT